MKNNYIRVLFFGIVVALVTISLLTYNNLNNYIEEVQMIRHSNRVFQAVQDVLSSIKDAEIGHRGYQLTRDSTYLQPYYSSISHLPGQIKSLDSLLAFNERQAKKADTLNLLIDNQFAVINQILSNASRSSLYMDQYESDLLARGKASMEEIRGVAGRILAEEEKTLNERVSREAKYRNTAPIALLVYALIALIGMTFLFIIILEALNKRWIAERKLKENVEQLKKEAEIREYQKRLLEERGILLKEAETLANMGSWKWHKKSDHLIWSDGLYRIWGQPPYAFEPSWNSFLQNVYEEDRQLVEDFLNEMKSEGSSLEVNFRIVLEGQPKYLLMVANVREDTINQVDILGTVLDVTTYKNAEKDMLIAERLSMTGRIARTIAHEVRNPLTSLNLALEQLKDEMPQDNDSLTMYSEVIQRNANRIEQLIGEMLNSSRPKELNLELVPVEEVMEETIALARDRVNLANMKLERKYEEGLPRILMDREKMRIALLNILVNAVEAMEVGKGVLKVEVKSANGFVVVSISDNGKGIAHGELEKLYDPFYTAKAGGMGLGLTSTKNILSSHSAAIEVVSALNEGTTFYVYYKLPS